MAELIRKHGVERRLVRKKDTFAIHPDLDVGLRISHMSQHITLSSCLKFDLSLRIRF
jgi:hypothetical protein